MDIYICRVQGWLPPFTAFPTNLQKQKMSKTNPTKSKESPQTKKEVQQMQTNLKDPYNAAHPAIKGKVVLDVWRHIGIYIYTYIHFPLP